MIILFIKSKFNWIELFSFHHLFDDLYQETSLSRAILQNWPHLSVPPPRPCNPGVVDAPVWSEGGEMAVDSARNIASGEDEETSSPRVSKSLRVTMEEIRVVAQKFADEPVQSPEPGVWGVLTAISNNARQRRQVWLLLCVHSLPATFLKP